MEAVESKRGVVLLSGGPDSATVAYWAKYNGYDLHAIALDLGQPSAKKEIQCAKKIARELKIPLKIAKMDFARSLASLSPEEDFIPLMHGREPNVPFGIGLAIVPAAIYALSNGLNSIMLGVHADDMKASIEYSPKTFRHFEETIRCATGIDNFIIEIPFARMPKVEVIQLGYSLGVPFELTWSCMKSDDIHCGSCEGCIYRQKAFLEAGISDPTIYKNRAKRLKLELQK